LQRAILLAVLTATTLGPPVKILASDEVVRIALGFQNSIYLSVYIVREKQTMAMPQTIQAVPHPYANGEVKRMLINGEWVRAASGKTFESRNPATGDLLATGAARAAFEGPWSRFKPYER
jgi:hypothetical protein